MFDRFLCTLYIAQTFYFLKTWINSVVYKLDQNRLSDFLQVLCHNRTVYALAQVEDQYHLVRADEWQAGKHTLGSFRPVEPLKSLVFRPREFIGPITTPFDAASDSAQALADKQGRPSEPSSLQERIVIGVKNCDLSALKIHDYVFLKTEPVDPFYAEAREKTIIVSCDCTDACDVCFCPAVGEQPYVKDGFDINISPLSGGFVVESGSERGKKLLKDMEQYLEPADEATVQERDRKRAEMTQRVCEQAVAKGLECGTDFQKAIQKTSESKLWDDFAENCVECGACNFVCCTCHCFLLADGFSKDRIPARVKQWDSCLYRNFAKVAGGANPRRHRAERLYNRFDKKFNFFREILGTYACNGCGRCVEACAGKIDIRDVLKRAVESRE